MKREALIDKILDPRNVNLTPVGQALVAAARKARAK